MGKIMTVRPTETIYKEISKKARSVGITRNALVCSILYEWLKADSLKESSKTEK